MWILLVHQPYEHVAVDAVADDESSMAVKPIILVAWLKYRHRKRDSNPIWRHRLQVEIIAYVVVVCQYQKSLPKKRKRPFW